MKVSTTIAEAAGVQKTVEKGHVALLMELFKARLTMLVLTTSAVGFYVGSRGALDGLQFLQALGGTALLACGAASLNQWLERDLDARMRRTEDRPLPSGRMRPNTALVLGLAISVAGLAVLVTFVNRTTALLGVVTLLVYLLIYTPLKRVTPLNTIVGAIPGALPPLMGWTAARGGLDGAGWSLFAILVFWQLPHFLAIAWMYRDDYERAGFAMLSVGDDTGEKTSAHVVAHTLGLLAVSLSPFALGLVGLIYLAGALVLGAVFLWNALRFARGTTEGRARRLFYASILYLPLLLGLMVLDKLR